MDPTGHEQQMSDNPIAADIITPFTEGNSEVLVDGNSLPENDHVNDLGRWTAEELALFDRDNHEGTPVGQYFNIPLPKEAEKVYLEIIRPVLLDYCDKTFTTFAMGALAYGLIISHPRNAILIVGQDLELKHLREIKDIINNLHVQIPFVVKCYNGETSSAANAAPRFQAYSQFPELGSSIAVMDKCSSFSLGPYVRLDNDNDSVYAISTFHGLLPTKEPSSSTQPTNTSEPSSSKIDDNNPISNRYSQSDPPIIIEQPSSSDHRNAIEAEKRAIEYLEQGPYGSTPNGRIKLMQYKESLLELENQCRKTLFGTVIAGEMDLVDIGLEGLTTSDWCLIKVDPSRIGSGNHITFLTDDREQKILFPVDSDWKYWIVGEEDMKIGSPVMKAGRATGVTVGCVDFLKFDVKLPHSPNKTVEFTVTLKGPVYFSDSGDSGGPVVGTNGALIGILIGGSLGVEVWEGHGSFGMVKLSYITPWSLIKQRVRENLGCGIELLKSNFGD